VRREECGELVAQLSHERRCEKAFLEQRQRAVVVPEAASTQRADPTGRAAGLGNDSGLAAQFA
jgi:hypothetical protein